MPMSGVLLDELRDFPALVRAHAGAIDRARWAEKPAPREFALVEHACHLRDFEIEGCHERLRRLLAEDDPELADFDGLAVAAARDYRSQDPELALADFARARAATVARFAALSDAQLARPGRLVGLGAITVARLAELLAEHDASHRAELTELRAFLRAGARPPG